MSSFTLKILAIILMAIDHVGFVLFPKITILRYIGRLAFPIFAFQLGIGFEHTKSKEKYILRMLIFTIISQIPFMLFIQSSIPGHSFLLNVGATLTCGLLALYCIEKIENKLLKYLFAFLIILMGAFIPMDYGWYGILTIVIFYIFRKDKLLLSAFYMIILANYCQIRSSTFNLPAILALIPILLYNNKKGQNAKYLFYIFYPLHLLILVFIKAYIFK